MGWATDILPSFRWGGGPPAQPVVEGCPTSKPGATVEVVHPSTTLRVVPLPLRGRITAYATGRTISNFASGPISA